MNIKHIEEKANINDLINLSENCKMHTHTHLINPKKKSVAHADYVHMMK